MDSTYIWTRPRNQCPLKVTKWLHLTNVPGNPGYKVDIKEQIVLQKGALVSSTSGCPFVDVYATEYKDLFLTKATKAEFDEISKVNVVTLINTRVAFAFYLSE